MTTPGLKFQIVYEENVKKDDIPKLPAIWRKKIRAAIEKKLVTAPEVFGLPLRSSLKNYRKLRVGEYRIIFRIEGTTVKVFLIQHRSTVYKTATNRLA